MKSTGIVRRIDDLGRIVVPKEIRRTLKIHEGDFFELFVEDNAVIFRKYSYLQTMLATNSDLVCRAIAGRFNCKAVIICDMDSVIAAAGTQTRLNEALITNKLQTVIRGRKLYQTDPSEVIQVVSIDDRYTAGIVAPILSEGEIHGAIVVMNDTKEEKPTPFDASDITLVEAMAAFLSWNLET